MEQKVLAALQAHNMVQAGDKIIVALSGGADSVALLAVLSSLQKQLEFTLEAAHFNHGLRGEEANADARFVQDLCLSKGIKLYTENAYMNEKLKPKGESVEMWARSLRYAFLQKMAEDKNVKIATAHTSSDMIETVLFNMARGSGPKGLAGIPPVRDCFIRPMLGASRAEVEDYCAANNLCFVTDSTNADHSYSRNRIRHMVLPQLELAHPGAQKAIARLAADMRELDDCLQKEASNLLERANVKQNKGQNGPVFLRFSESVQVGYFAQILQNSPIPVWRAAFAKIAGSSASRDTLEKMQMVLQGDRQSTQLPNQKRASLRQGVLWIEATLAPRQQKTKAYEIPLQEGILKLCNGWIVEVCVTSAMPKNEEFAKDKQKALPYVADYDKIAKYGVFRTRKPQDMYALPKRGHTKLLRKWMSEANVPQSMRDSLPVLADGNNVLWVYGAGFNNSLSPSQSTTNFLIINCILEE